MQTWNKKSHYLVCTQVTGGKLCYLIKESTTFCNSRKLLSVGNFCITSACTAVPSAESSQFNHSEAHPDATFCFWFPSHNYTWKLIISQIMHYCSRININLGLLYELSPLSRNIWAFQAKLSNNRIDANTLCMSCDLRLFCLPLQNNNEWNVCDFPNDRN